MSTSSNNTTVSFLDAPLKVNIWKLIVVFALSFFTYNAWGQSDFVKVKGGKLWKNDKPYYFIGTNLWYGAILGSEGQGGNRKRLCKELDTLKKLGIDNLRVLVGSDGAEGVLTKVEPTLQKAPGVYNDTILAGLDYLLKEMGKRDMVAVLYLNNAWEWSGGYGYYLEQAGAGKAPRPNEHGYPAYTNFVKSFSTNTKAQELFYDYVRFIVTRTNRYTGKKYTDDPAIMAWQIGNEPRAFSKETIPAFQKWLKKSSALIRSLDRNHLVSLGSEGVAGCEDDPDAFESICSDPNIDYITIHVWPYNWGWTKKDKVVESVDIACKKTKEYLDGAMLLSKKLQKPVVMEEFGYPRDGFSFAKSSTTNGRDAYYQYVFSQIGNADKDKTDFMGCNFWGWGGYAKPKHEQWLPGDDYCGDPAQEQQGLNSVFTSDKTTLRVIRQSARRLKNIGLK